MKQQNPEIERKIAWLNRYQDSLRTQKQLVSQIETARSAATSIQSPGGDIHTAPTGVHSDRVADAVQRIDLLQREYAAEVEHGVQIRAEIKTAIEALPDFMQTLVLYYRYLQGMKFDNVCRETGRTYWTIRTLHTTALDALELPEDSGTDTPES